MTRKEMAAAIDATLVRTDHDLASVDRLIKAAWEYRFACCFTLPCYMEYLRDALAGSGVCVGGVVGFPSGGETLSMKLFQAEENVRLQADEVDMVINIGYLLSGKLDEVTQEIRRIKDIVEGRPLKCIIETPLLTDEQICRASECIVKGGGDYVKTGTGWLGPGTAAQVRLIRQTIGDAAQIKAAGGIHTVETALALMDAGANRLGIGLKGACAILDEME